MKNLLIKLITLMLVVSTALFIGTACKQEAHLTFKTLTVNELNVSGKVSNATTKFNFNNEIIATGGYGFVVSTNSNGTNQVLTKEVDLVAGDNVVYVFLMKGDEVIKTYTVTIRRLPTYLVSFATGIDGVTVPSQTIEEGSLATKPDDLSISGYEFLGYHFDFNTPITQNVTINALWDIFALNGGTITGLTNCGKTFSEITIPESINGTVIKSIRYSAFEDCDNLTNVTIGNSATSIGSSAFEDCDSLTNVTIGNSVTSIGEEAFYGCDSLTKVNYTGSIDNWVQIWFADYDSNPLFCGDNLYINNELVTNAVISKATKINAYAFIYCDSLTNVTIGNSVTSIGDLAFFCCSSLTNVTIGNSVTSIGDSAFAFCDSLTSITVDSSNTGYKSIAGVLYSKDGTELIYYPASKTNTSFTIPNSVTSIGKHAFRGCDSLTSITFSDTSTWYRTTDSSDFENKTNGTEIDVTNANNNAKSFKSIYNFYYWYKK